MTATPDHTAGWQARSACRGLDATIFYPDPEDEAAVQRAVDVCGACPVRAECLDHALSWREHTGVWGGATEQERRRILRSRRRSA